MLPPTYGPGRRRLARAIGAERVLSANELGARLDETVLRAIERERPELVVSWFWTRRLSKAVLAAARLGGIGAHPSLLPRHRGPDPYFWAIDSGDHETGVTVHRLTERYDDGDVLASSRLVIGNRDAWQLARALDRPSLVLLREAVRSFVGGMPPMGAPKTSRSRASRPSRVATSFAWIFAGRRSERSAACGRSPRSRGFRCRSRGSTSSSRVLEQPRSFPRRSSRVKPRSSESRKSSSYERRTGRSQSNARSST